ncbi:D-Ala-D-Ala carboxypeptidase family metallohydrolase [Algoriphagus sp. D3-2-R+10]|uniref:D-Ala-D-Ala carboxypeptidase family metallohydrolase n=1 Tax=Algoriphagus aurantiacus TaxID=3103948 RepID=UPI002B37D0E3|nr:D-Ala-D-Ala carboxypeptidase family metallohydrolase [Algoriphagus sp. D3-2-R+10]MEB2775224.1 D-Ala-D-Ala carboxypeptidase family metallohydrolase [Algoriphagus sp. D3-2-R+10]
MQLTSNFALSEFTCKCGCTFPDELINNINELAINLQLIRYYIKLPIIINSGYRCPKHNKNEGGKSKSKHLTAIAADIKVKGLTPKQLAVIIKEMMNEGIIKSGGLKAYRTFVHYDFRGKYVTW